MRVNLVCLLQCRILQLLLPFLVSLLYVCQCRASEVNSSLLQSEGSERVVLCIEESSLVNLAESNAINPKLEGTITSSYQKKTPVLLVSPINLDVSLLLHESGCDREGLSFELLKRLNQTHHHSSLSVNSNDEGDSSAKKKTSPSMKKKMKNKQSKKKTKKKTRDLSTDDVSDKYRYLVVRQHSRLQSMIMMDDREWVLSWHRLLGRIVLVSSDAQTTESKNRSPESADPSSTDGSVSDQSSSVDTIPLYWSQESHLLHVLPSTLDSRQPECLSLTQVLSAQPKINALPESQSSQCTRWSLLNERKDHSPSLQSDAMKKESSMPRKSEWRDLLFTALISGNRLIDRQSLTSAVNSSLYQNASHPALRQHGSVLDSHLLKNGSIQWQTQWDNGSVSVYHSDSLSDFHSRFLTNEPLFAIGEEVSAHWPPDVIHDTVLSSLMWPALVTNVTKVPRHLPQSSNEVKGPGNATLRFVYELNYRMSGQNRTHAMVPELWIEPALKCMNLRRDAWCERRKEECMSVPQMTDYCRRTCGVCVPLAQKSDEGANQSGEEKDLENEDDNNDEYGINNDGDLGLQKYQMDESERNRSRSVLKKLAMEMKPLIDHIIDSDLSGHSNHNNGQPSEDDLLGAQNSGISSTSFGSWFKNRKKQKNGDNEGSHSTSYFNSMIEGGSDFPKMSDIARNVSYYLRIYTDDNNNNNNLNNDLDPLSLLTDWSFLNSLGEISMFTGNLSLAESLFKRCHWLSGNGQCQFRLGQIYHLNRDYGRSNLFYYFGSNSGNIESKLSLSFKHDLGVDGLAKSCLISLRYLQSAAKQIFGMDGVNQGHGLIANDWLHLRQPMFSEQISLLSAKRKVRERSLNEDSDAVEYLRQKAESSDDLHSLLTIGTLTFYGLRGIQQDMNESLRLFEKALELHPESRMVYGHLGNWYAKQVALNWPDMKKEDLNEDQNENAIKNESLMESTRIRRKSMNESIQRALQYYSKGAKLMNDSTSMVGLGYFYLNGIGTIRNETAAFEWFLKSTRYGDPIGAFYTGLLYLTGVGLTGGRPDIENAGQMFMRSAQQGFALGLYYSGLLYMPSSIDSGLGPLVKLSITESCRMSHMLVRSAVEHSYLNKRLMQSRWFYINGDYRQAFYSYHHLAEQGFEEAQSSAAFLLVKDYLSVGLSSSSSNQGSVNNKDDDAYGPQRWFDDPKKAAVKYLEWSARLDNSDSQRLLGDYHYYAWHEQYHQSEINEKNGREDTSNDDENDGDIHDSSESDDDNIESLSTVIDTHSQPSTIHKVKIENRNQSSNESSSLMSKRKERAAKWYQRAAENRKHPNAQAMFNLAVMHHFADGRTRDLDIAKRYYDSSMTRDVSGTLPCRMGLALVYVDQWLLSRFGRSLSGFVLRSLFDPDFREGGQNETLLLSAQKNSGSESSKGTQSASTKTELKPGTLRYKANKVWQGLKSTVQQRVQQLAGWIRSLDLMNNRENLMVFVCSVILLVLMFVFR